MASRIFVDVGAHLGSSAADALDNRYLFDKIISVEPDPFYVDHLMSRFAKEIAHGRYLVAPFGLSDRCGSAPLYGDNSGGGASLHASKFASDCRKCRNIETVNWDGLIERYDLGDADLYVKINAEGAEIAIIEAILASSYANIRRLLIDFDIVKTPFGAWAKWEAVRQLRDAEIEFDLVEDIVVKRSSRPGLHNWLMSIPEVAKCPVPPHKPAAHVHLRTRYRELVSAAGIRLDAFKIRL